MILSTCFYIDNTGWFKEQFELSRCLFNQARHFFRDYYDKNKAVIRENDLEKVLTYISHLKIGNYHFL